MRKIAVLLTALVLLMPLCRAAAEDETVRVEYAVTYHYDLARAMLSLINEQRTADQVWQWNADDATKTYFSGLPPLAYDYGLEKTAMLRAAELAIRYAHYRPNGEICFSAFPSMSHLAENIGYTYPSTSTEWMFELWWEEEEPYVYQGHRRNLLDEANKTIGIGCVSVNGVYYWAQALASGKTGQSAGSLPDLFVVSVAPELLDVGASVAPDPGSCSLRITETASLPKLTGWGGALGMTRFTALDVIWESADGALLIADGQFTAAAAGETRLTAAFAGETFTVPITVQGCEEHQWDNGKITKAPGCAKSGVKTFTCTVCGQKFTEPVAPLGHNYQLESEIPATQEAEGLKTWVCTRCHDRQEEKLPKLPEEVLPGDVNGDSRVDGRDLVRLARYLAGADVTVNLKNADYNGDGSLDGRDVLRLARYLANS